MYNKALSLILHVIIGYLMDNQFKQQSIRWETPGGIGVRILGKKGETPALCASQK